MGAEPVAGEVRRRGRPRSAQARTAILDAAADLLLAPDGATVTIDDVARRAGVSKATIYRWWRTRETLTLDALYHEWAAGHRVRDTGTLRGDLLSILRPWARRVAQRDYGAAIAQLIAESRTDPTFADEYRARFVHPRRESGRVALARAIDRGEIPANTDLEAALDLLYGPLYHRLLHGHQPVNDRFVGQVVDAAIAALAAGAITRGRARARHP